MSITGCDSPYPEACDFANGLSKTADEFPTGSLGHSLRKAIALLVADGFQFEGSPKVEESVEPISEALN